MSTTLDKTLRHAFDHIDFVERYKRLSAEYAHDGNAMKNYSNDKVLEIIRSLGHEAKYMAGENFFMIKEKQGDYQIQFNISCKYGAVELIFDFLRNDKRIEPSGIWDEITEMLTADAEPIKLPAFRSYDELQDLLAKVFRIYEELKTELMNTDS